jgi:hypothetical protein
VVETDVKEFQLEVESELRKDNERDRDFEGRLNQER